MKAGPWKCRSVDAEENQLQVFPPRPQPLEIANGAISTFPPPRRCRFEKWKSKPRISTSDRLDFALKTKRKETLAAGRCAPGFRLILE